MNQGVTPRLGTRSGGVLLHPTSLPGPGGVGGLGPAARRFAGQLAAAGQSWWQTLPVGAPGYGNCPYMALSAFAGSPDLVSLETLVEEGLLPPEQLSEGGSPPAARVRYDEARRFREPRLRRAEAEFFARASSEERARFEAFCSDHASWLEDYALFEALRRETNGSPWTSWPAPIRRRDPGALAEARRRLEREIRHQCFLQYQFARQWSGLRDHCRRLGLGLIGDLPIYVAHESVDVWAHPELFRLDEAGNPRVVAGVPPDYFSPTGQRWGHPLFDWDRMRESGYEWWRQRLARTLERFDAVRLDHFIGFCRYWEIPAECETAVGGRWVDGPGAPFFEAMQRFLGPVPVIAEDLGVVTPEVTALRERFGFPGMRVLQFAFGGDPRTNVHLPHLHPRCCAVFTGTHDNDTIQGWYRDLCRRAREGDPGAAREKAHLHRYLGCGPGGEAPEIHWEMTRLALSSVADLCLIPMQDLLGLGGEARMNFPARAEGNWEWRMTGADEEAWAASLERLGALAESFGRTAPRDDAPAAKEG